VELLEPLLELARSLMGEARTVGTAEERVRARTRLKRVKKERVERCMIGRE
jgi:hypothetical protein